MWETESELRDFIKKKLEETNHRVKTEVTIRGFRIDLIAEKEESIEKLETEKMAVDIVGTKKVIKCIEVKLHNRNEIYNAINKCINLSYFPELDEVYVAFPEIYLNKEIEEILKMHPIGAILVTKEKCEIIPPYRSRKPPNLHPTSSRPFKAVIGKIFEIYLGAYNDGEKNAYNVKFKWKPAKPFKIPFGEKNIKTVSKIEPGQSVSMPFKIEVRPKSKPGKYGIFASISAEGLDPISTSFEIPIEETHN